MLAAFGMALAIVCASIIAAALGPAPKAGAHKLPRRSLRQPDTSAIRPTIPGANRYQRDRVIMERADELRAEQCIP